MGTFTPDIIGGNLTAANGQVSLALVLGGGATGWEATESLDYVSLAPLSGSASEPVVVTYEANNTFDERDVVIIITTTGTTGVPITRSIALPQEGSQGIEVETNPANLTSLTASAGDILVDVDLLGSATDWNAAITTGTAFLSLNVETGVEGDDVLTISYGENTTVSSRRGSVTLTATGGTGIVQGGGAFAYAGGRHASHAHDYAYVYARARRR